VNIKIWKNLTLDKDAAFALAQEHGLPFFLAMLLQIRGKTSAADVAALTESTELLSDPFLLKDMEKAVYWYRKSASC
jgi:single-stranded-DNA-specific exonuclease